MTYAILGITGQTGRAAAETLLRDGASVRALLRDPSRGAEWADRGVEVVEGDLADRASLIAAFQGVEGAYVLLPPQWGVPDVFAALEPLIENLVAAIEEANVPRVVLLSSVGAHQTEGTGPIRSLGPIEAALNGRPGATFLRASYFQENHGAALAAAQEGVFYAAFDPDLPIEMVATVDIGREAARLLTSTEAPPVVNLAGPRPRTLRESAAALGTLLGRTLDVVRIPPEGVVEPLREMGAGHLAELYGEMNRALDEGRIEFEEPAVITRGTTELEETLARLVG